MPSASTSSWNELNTVGQLSWSPNFGAAKPAPAQIPSPSASLSTLSLHWLAAAKRAVEAAFGQPPVLFREGGSIPVVLSFKQILGIDTLLLGWGRNSDNLHSPDEHIHLQDFHRGTQASACLWKELAAVRLNR